MENTYKDVCSTVMEYVSDPGNKLWTLTTDIWTSDIQTESHISLTVTLMTSD